MKRYSFYFHYNKPATAQAGRVRISVHWKGACHLTDNVTVTVPTWGRVRKTAPRFVMSGLAREIIFNDGMTTIL